jgi:hypothetical protein
MSKTQSTVNGWVFNTLDMVPGIEPVQNPPTGQSTAHYDAANNVFHVIDSDGNSLINSSAIVNTVDGVVTVPALNVAGVAMDVTSPVTGQVLTAQDANNASWQTPTAGGGVSSVFGRTGAVTATGSDYSANYDALGAATAAQAAAEAFTASAVAAIPPVPNQQFLSVAVGVIASATPSLVITATLPVAYADVNYQIQGSIQIAETPGAAAATEIICIGSTQILTAQTFCFVVCNASSLPRTVTAVFTTYHA